MKEEDKKAKSACKKLGDLINAETGVDMESYVLFAKTEEGCQVIGSFGNNLLETILEYISTEHAGLFSKFIITSITDAVINKAGGDVPEKDKLN